MPNYKVDYEFNAGSVDGWTETFYLAAANTTLALQNATSGPLYVGARRAVLHAAFSLDFVRVSDVAILRDSLIRVYDGLSGQGLFGDKASLFEQAWDGLLCRGEAGAQARRAVHLRGLPAGQMDATGKLTFTAPFTTVIQTWQNKVGNLGVGFTIRRQTPTQVERPTQCDIIGGARAIRLTWAARPAGVTVGTQINTSKIGGASPQINSRWKVQYVDATTATMYPKLTKLYGTPDTAVAKVSTVAITFEPISNVIPERGVKLNTGKASGLPVGRRKQKAV